MPLPLLYTSSRTRKKELTPRTPPRNKNPLPINLILRNSIKNHIRYRLRVPTPIMLQRLSTRHVPAGPTMRRARPHRDIPLLIGALGPGDLGVAKVRLRGGLARVDDHHQRRIRDHLVWDVYVPFVHHLSVCEPMAECWLTGYDLHLDLGGGIVGIVDLCELGSHDR